MKWFQPFKFSFVILCLFACKNGGKSGESKHDTGAVVRVSIPSNYLMFSADEMESWVCRALQIPILSATSSGMQLRIHEGYRDDTGHMILLKDSNNHWSADLFNYKVSRNDSGRMNVFAYQCISLGRPLSGWKEFSNELSALNFESLQKQGQLIDRFDIEPVVVDLKVVSKNKYTHNNFSDPYHDKSPDAKNLVALIDFLKEEFQIK